MPPTPSSISISLPRNQLAVRYNSSRYWGSNNVFLDPASPVTYDSISDNGTEEMVSTDTGSVSLISGLTTRLTSHLRAQFSRDLRQSYTNTNSTLIKVSDIIDGIGRSDLLPRATREHRAQLAETLSFDTSRHALKFGGDTLITWIYDFFPSQQSGEYLFDIIKVDPFTFEPWKLGSHSRLCAPTRMTCRNTTCKVSDHLLLTPTATTMPPLHKTPFA